MRDSSVNSFVSRFREVAHDRQFMQVTLALQAKLVFSQGKLATNIARMNIHDRIRERRIAQQLSQEALGETLGVTYQTIQQWENGKTAPKTTRLEALARALNTTAEYLLFGTPPPSGSLDEDGANKHTSETGYVSLSEHYSSDIFEFRPVFVAQRPREGMPERLWTDGNELVGATDKFAVLATTDARAFMTPVIDTAMYPRYKPGEFALVLPGSSPDIEDDVLVRMTTGETLLRMLVSRRGGITLGSYNESGTRLVQEVDISWMYLVGYPVPARLMGPAND